MKWQVRYQEDREEARVDGRKRRGNLTERWGIKTEDEHMKERAGVELLFRVFESSWCWLEAWPHLGRARDIEKNLKRERKRLLSPTLKGPPHEVLVLPRADTPHQQLQKKPSFKLRGGGRQRKSGPPSSSEGGPDIKTSPQQERQKCQQEGRL